MVVEQFRHAQFGELSLHSPLQPLLQLLLQPLPGLPDRSFGWLELQAQLPSPAHGIEHLLNAEILSSSAEAVAASAATACLNQMGLTQLQQDLLQARLG